MKRFDPEKTVYIIDGSSFLYRAYYAMKPLHTKQGEPVQAVYGFVRMIKKLISQFNPSYMVVVWDAPGKTARHELFAGYKATRQAPPSDLFEQKKHIRTFNKLIGLAELEIGGIEADDLMYSLAKDMRQEGLDVVMVTTDKDMAQMIDEHTFVYDAFKEQLCDKSVFEQKMGFSVAKLPFYYALVGDSSDNIPGVKGIGHKGALELVSVFESLDDLYARIDQVAKARVRLALQEHKEDAFLSYNLFLLRYHQLHISKEQLKFKHTDLQNARPFFQELNFVSLLKSMGPAEEQLSLISKKKLDKYIFKKVATEQELMSLVEAIKEAGICAIDTETTGVNPEVDQLIGISCAVKKGEAWYIPFGHKTNQTQLQKEVVIAALKPLLEDSIIKKIVHHASFDKAVLWHAGIDMQGLICDTMLAARLVSKEWQSASLKSLSEYFLDEQMISYQEAVKDNGYADFSFVPLDLATEYAAADAHQTLQLYTVLKERLVQEGLLNLFETIEQPLQHLLLEMEQRGIYLDKKELEQLGKQVQAELITIEDAIINQVGPAYANINLNSPKQVEHLLFGELKLTPQKKSAKGSYSTDSQVLQALAKEHPIAGMIAKYRELAKLKSTYIDALPAYISKKTDRVHTHFSQTSVATGRLSSSDPNLQNIPADVHGYGIQVRAAFKAGADECFVSADYSQIELRVMAYLSQDAALLSAFEQNIDIHAQTAAALFSVPFEQITHEQRQIGKRINFSVLYGLTPYGLSKDLGLSFKDAKQYIETYFAQYPGVKMWMDKVIDYAKQHGYVTTLYGRRRYVPAIYESNHALYQEAVRVAVNTVVQGTAADIMKLGMIQLAKILKQENIPAYIILQIHDELLLSVHSQYATNVAHMAQEVLEQVVAWNVPLQVTVRSGLTWKDVTK